MCVCGSMYRYYIVNYSYKQIHIEKMIYKFEQFYIHVFFLLIYNPVRTFLSWHDQNNIETKKLASANCISDRCINVKNDLNSTKHREDIDSYNITILYVLKLSVLFIFLCDIQ